MKISYRVIAHLGLTKQTKFMAWVLYTDNGGDNGECRRELEIRLQSRPLIHGIQGYKLEERTKTKC